MFLFYLQLFIFILCSLFFLFNWGTCTDYELLLHLQNTAGKRRQPAFSSGYKASDTTILQILGLTCSFWDLLPKPRVTSHTSEPASCPKKHQHCPKEWGNTAPALSPFYPGALGCQWWRIRAPAAPQPPLGQISWCNWCCSPGTSDLKQLRVQLSVYGFHLVELALPHPLQSHPFIPSHVQQICRIL